jgi:hypothetical protein
MPISNLELIGCYALAVAALKGWMVRDERINTML